MGHLEVEWAVLLFVSKLLVLRWVWLWYLMETLCLQFSSLCGILLFPMVWNKEATVCFHFSVFLIPIDFHINNDLG